MERPPATKDYGVALRVRRKMASGRRKYAPRNQIFSLSHTITQFLQQFVIVLAKRRGERRGAYVNMLETRCRPRLTHPTELRMLILAEQFVRFDLRVIEHLGARQDWRTRNPMLIQKR